MNSFFTVVLDKLYRTNNREIDFDEIFQNKKGSITFINPYSYSILRKKKNRDAVDMVNCIFVDGILLVKILKLIGVKTHRISFDMTSLAPKLFKFCEDNDKTIYFVGTKQDILEKSIENIKKEYTNLKIKGYRNGYFKTDKEKDLFQSELVSLNLDYLVVGMGTPLQERFILEMKNKQYRGNAYTCGGFLHQSSSSLIYYPAWIDKFELRWFYRMFKEKEVRKRILIEYPLFLFKISFDLFIHYFCQKPFKN
ncbi:WecB/TagA/CpsF family glycosyltransferase [Aquimarina muelleri]|uniref:Teichoic acid biosynthesis protein A n=1 Tax=Aquimarina muelleri TaxID=279356 RepID=A0A918N5V3_9FLAO|nr:WecB/TagA/CpsF family glycosyltransferase [Aquimarina muelleri]MCX2764288.1 WecB/TagA/CpsF family glycosyltransferase [Aquimarina muelleri]GGX32199.1 teichoic acid biosynthesis protein A [Aquimarina muelleri]